MSVPVEAIVRERLSDRRRACIRDHVTPALLLGIGHDHNSGEVHLYVPDDPLFDTNMLRDLLRLALRELDQPAS